MTELVWATVEVLGLASIAVGVLLLLGLGWALVASGVLLVALSLWVHRRAL